MIIDKPTVELWVDGSAYPNDKLKGGGWGAILLKDSKEKQTIRELSGYIDPPTTNNRAETLAVINGLKVLQIPCNVKVYTDSRYFQKVFYRLKTRLVINANTDIWEELAYIVKHEKHTLEVIRVKGHSDFDLNRLADKLAGNAAATREGIDRRYEIEKETDHPYVAGKRNGKI